MLWLDAPPVLIALVYLVAGWQILLDIPAYTAALDAAELTMLAVGGGLYSVGRDRLREEAAEPVAGGVRVPRGVPLVRRRRRGLSLGRGAPPHGLMLFRAGTLDAIAAGEVTIAFRRWTRPTVKQGGTLITRVGVLAIDALEVVDPRAITDDDARRAGHESRDDVLGMLAGRAGDVYRVSFHVAGEDPRIALRDARRPRCGRRRDAHQAARPPRRPAVGGAWTERVLRLIRDHEAVRAGDLADELGMERLAFKADVRKLKALGLTESLGTGYRLSPRGQAWLDR